MVLSTYKTINLMTTIHDKVIAHNTVTVKELTLI